MDFSIVPSVPLSFYWFLPSRGGKTNGTMKRKKLRRRRRRAFLDIIPPPRRQRIEEEKEEEEEPEERARFKVIRRSIKRREGKGDSCLIAVTLLENLAEVPFNFEWRCLTADSMATVNHTAP